MENAECERLRAGAAILFSESWTCLSRTGAKDILPRRFLGGRASLPREKRLPTKCPFDRELFAIPFDPVIFYTVVARLLCNPRIDEGTTERVKKCTIKRAATI